MPKPEWPKSLFSQYSQTKTKHVNLKKHKTLARSMAEKSFKAVVAAKWWNFINGVNFDHFLINFQF